MAVHFDISKPISTICLIKNSGGISILIGLEKKRQLFNKDPSMTEKKLDKEEIYGNPGPCEERNKTLHKLQTHWPKIRREERQ